MAYTPTTWTTGDTVTATKMNKIENGIANAGGGNPTIKMVTNNFGSYSHDCGSFLLCTLESGVYVPADLFLPGFGRATPSQQNLYVYGGNATIFVTLYPSSADNGNYVLVFVESTYLTYSYSGNISQESVTVDGFTGSGHIITGDCTISMTE